VLVRVRAVSLNYRDLLICQGKYPASTKDGVIPTSDGAGEIVALGEDAASAATTGNWKVGDRVAAIFTPSYLGGTPRYTKGLEGSLGGDIDGMLAQYVLLDATALVRVPDYMSFEEAATLPCAGVTAYNALYGCVNPLRANHVVLVLGTGGVSVLAAQIALAAGARVIATSSSDDKLQRMKQLGVAEGDLINYKSTPEWGKKVRELTGGQGVDHVLEIGGSVCEHCGPTSLDFSSSVLAAYPIPSSQRVFFLYGCAVVLAPSSRVWRPLAEAAR
jgi:NADPH:quinone reductase-like Zn-dependent oxidoreductase